MKIKGLLGFGAALLCAVTALGQTVDSVLTNGLAEPYGIAVDPNNVFYITDSANNRIVKYTPDTGEFLTLSGSPAASGTNDGVGVLARFFSPQGIVLARGGLVVSDSGSHTLRFVALNGTVSTLAGIPGVAGAANSANPLAATFRTPIGLAVDTAGNIYIADSKNSAIRKLDTANVVTTIADAADGLLEPSGVAVGDGGQIFVADTRNHSIKVIEPDGTVTLVAGSNNRLISGYTDSLFATNAIFNNPRALMWLGPSLGLLVSDSGNHTLRRVYTNTTLGTFTVEHFAGQPGDAGLLNGSLAAAKFNSPVSLGRDLITGGFLVVDRANNAIRRVQTSPPQPPVAAPVIGWVDFVKDEFGERVSKLVPVTQNVFKNDVIIAVLAEAGTETFFTFGPSPASPLEDNIPVPNRTTGASPPAYEDGLPESQVPPSMISPQTDVTIKAVGTQDGRSPSSVVVARFQFKTANPVIFGDNPASFEIRNETSAAQMFYTIDGSDPTNGPPSLGPVTTGEVLALQNVTNDVTFRMRAFRANFKPSDIVSKVFSPTNFVPNELSFGFSGGEASSQFIGAAGQRFFAPVTLSLLPGAAMYSLQFNMTVTNLTGPAVTPGAVGFDSMLLGRIEGSSPPAYTNIPPLMAVGVDTIIFTNLSGENLVVTNIIPIFTNLMFTNASQNLLGVGWLETISRDFLYNTRAQHLVSFSQAHNTLFESTLGRVVVGAYSFQIPSSATSGQTYEIRLGRPSATADGVQQDVFIDTPTDGSLTVGAINSIKRVTVGSAPYVVGDVLPFRWVNAGDFGDTNILNNDIMQVFRSAVYGLNRPPEGSDFFDAMDSSDGSSVGINDGNDVSINSIMFGDGQLNVDDIFVTFRRSLDPALVWYARYWSNGVRQAVAVPNQFRGSPVQDGEETSLTMSPPTNGPIRVDFSIGDVVAEPGQLASIPIRANILGGVPLRVLMLSLKVDALDGSPAIYDPIHFVPVPMLGTPSAGFTFSRSDDHYAAAWLNRNIEGLTGDALLGQLLVRVPTNASPSAVYRVRFEHVSASPTGTRLFRQTVDNGILALSDRDLSSYGDGIPDRWRYRHFGTLANFLALANADADGDGVPNWAEFKAGTNPNDIRSFLRLLSSQSSGPIKLRWPTIVGKTYVIEASDQLVGGEWVVVATGIVGNGEELEYTDNVAGDGNRFYRIRLVETP